MFKVVVEIIWYSFDLCLQMIEIPVFDIQKLFEGYFVTRIIAVILWEFWFLKKKEKDVPPFSHVYTLYITVRKMTVTVDEAEWDDF